MVDAVTAISASAATSATAVERSLSISSEPDNKWVAERQSQIDADQASLRGEVTPAATDQRPLSEDAEEELPPLFEGHSRRRRAHPGIAVQDDEPSDTHLLSGESERIGSTNFDDDTPFGGRTAII